MNPTDAITADLAGFIATRRRDRAEHLVDGLPDYSFGIDRKLRTQLAAIAPIRELARFIVRSHEPIVQQMNMMDCIAVGPDQFPEIFRIAGRCAETLGIGMPRVFISADGEAQAWTLASDDTRPSIVLSRLLVSLTQPDELTAIIGRECGHIHNLHSAYNTLAELLSNSTLRAAMAAAAPPAAAMIGVLGAGLKLFMLNWRRAAEITCDRAGAICAGGVHPMIRALAKLKTPGGAFADGFNADAYVRQLDSVADTPLKLREYFASQPLTQKRIAALKLLERSDLLESWLPGTVAPDGRLDRAGLERACAELISVSRGRVPA